MTPQESTNFPEKWWTNMRLADKHRLGGTNKIVEMLFEAELFPHSTVDHFYCFFCNHKMHTGPRLLIKPTNHASDA